MGLSFQMLLSTEGNRLLGKRAGLGEEAGRVQSAAPYVHSQLLQESGLHGKDGGLGLSNVRKIIWESAESSVLEQMASCRPPSPRTRTELAGIRAR